MSVLKLSLLGPPQVCINDTPVELETRKAIALLTYLAVTAESNRRDSLVLLLWPDHGQSEGRTVLRQTLYSLNKALPGDWFSSSRDSIGLRAEASIVVDVREFNDLISRCEDHGHPKEIICPDCRDPLAEAIDLYRDDFLAGFTLNDSVNFDDWQFTETEDLRASLISALERLVRCLSAEAEYTEATKYARRWLALDRLYETAHCRLMELYAWSGQRASALRQYQECLRVLASEMEAAPMQATTELFNAIKAGRIPDPAEYWHGARQPSSPNTRAEEQPAGKKGRQTAGTDGASTPIAEVAPRIPTPPMSEYRIASILFAELHKGRTAVDAVNQLAVPEEIDRVVTQYGGQIARAYGDTFTIVFGGTTIHEDDPEMAVRAAVDMLREARKLRRSFSAGINTGSIYFEHDRGKQDSVALAGNVVNIAAQLSDRANAGQVLVGEMTYRLTRRAFDYAPVSVKLRGHEDTDTAYRVEGLVSEPKKARGIEGLRTELIGRHGELSSLKEMLSNALTGKGGIVSIAGESGVGKSRLVSELKAIAAGSRVDGDGESPRFESASLIWLEGRCLELGREISFWPVIDMLREYFAWRSEDSDEMRSERITAALGEMASKGEISQLDRDRIGPLLGSLLSIRYGDEWDERAFDVAPEIIRRDTLVALRDFFVSLSRRKPVVLVFEDLHLADHHSLDLVSFLMESLPCTPMLIVCCYRPEKEHRCNQIPTIASHKCPEHYLQLYLRELNKPQSVKLLDALIGTGSHMASIKETILEKSQGNPFFVEEVVRSLIDTGVIVRAGETWHMRGDSAAVKVPESVKSVILDRVDRLNDELKRVLQSAAVLGRVFSRRVFLRLLQNEPGLDGLLRELETREIIFEERSVPEEEYAFEHILMQEAIYESIGEPNRMGLHLRVADVIETLYQEKEEEHYEQLAFHYDRGGDSENAIKNLSRAGEKAKRIGASIEAASHLSRALKLTKTLPDSANRSRLELDILIALGVPLVLTKGHSSPEAKTAYERARDLCREVGTIEQLFEVMIGLRRYAISTADLDSAFNMSERLIDLAVGIEDPLVKARAFMFHSETTFHRGDFQASSDTCEKGLAI